MQGRCVTPFEFRHLRYFVAVAEELHFTRAARKLNLTQSSLTRQIQQLESHLGVALFIRDKKHVELTSAGQIFHQEAGCVLPKLERAAKMAQSARARRDGTLSIGYSPTLDMSFVKEARTVIENAMPGTSVKLVSAAWAQQVGFLLDGSLQAAFVEQPISDPAIEATSLHREPMVTALHANHRLANVRSVRLSELAEEPLIWFARAQHPEFFDHFVAVCREAQYQPRIVQEVTTPAESIDFVRDGAGVALLRASSSHQRIKGVVFRKVAGVSFEFDTALAYRRDITSAALDEAVAYLREHFPGGLQAQLKFVRCA